MDDRLIKTLKEIEEALRECTFMLKLIEQNTSETQNGINALCEKLRRAGVIFE